MTVVAAPIQPTLMRLTVAKKSHIMTPQFASAELNRLLQLEMAEGVYQSSEEVLLAGLKVLRESRDFRTQMADRLTSLGDGRAIVLESDEALGEFLDAIDSEVDAERREKSRPAS
jgi:hypothetical protein